MLRYKLLQGDSLELMKALNSVDTIFADPPDGIGLKYTGFEDNMDAGDYIEFLDKVLMACMEKALTTYVSFNARWLIPVCSLMSAYQDIYPLEVRMLIQGFTFGQNRTTDLANNYRPILRVRKPDAPLFPDAVRVESERMKIGDKRANPAGRVPGDVWRSDFLEYARVTGNSKQRRKYHPTQLHEGLVEDCLLMSTPPGGTVMDPFCGTGTTLRVCLDNEWSCTTMDVSSNYCEKVAEEHKMSLVSRCIWSK